MQVDPVPVQAPLQPANAASPIGSAVSVTPVPMSYDSLQSVPQSIPAGLLVTRPEPLPPSSTVSSGEKSSPISNASELAGSPHSKWSYATVVTPWLFTYALVDPMSSPAGRLVSTIAFPSSGRRTKRTPVPQPARERAKNTVPSGVTDGACWRPPRFGIFSSVPSGMW